jgi:hypothetical protein
MGSVSTHFRISRQVVSQLTAVRPDENYSYLFLGNFLTDLSQVRDPYACIHAKRAVLQAAGPLGAGTKTWMAELLGQAKAGKRYGALTQFLADIARAFTHLAFADDSPARSGTALALEHAFGGPLPGPLPPAEVDRVLDGALTQYYPHEHLDFPPYYDPALEATRNTSPAVPPQGRLIAYLTEQQQYLVEELTKTELAWLAASGLGTVQQRNDALRRLGHLLHAVEDYYFHSNFAELHQWQRIRRAAPAPPIVLPAPLPGTQGTPPVSPFLLLHDLDGSIDQTTDVALRRRFARRLRYPVFSRGSGSTSTAEYWDGPSRDASNDAALLVLTGGFGGKDIFHSLRGGLEIAGLVLNPTSDLALERLVASTDERRKAAADADYRDKLIAQHAKQLANGSYDKRIDRAAADGKLSPAMASALSDAFRIDTALQRKHWALNGVGGFLIRILCQLQDELDRSDRQVAALDGDATSIFAEATDNGTSAETIGSHSLLAKDTDEERPMRQAALALAEYASGSIAVLLARRVTSDRDSSHGLDWDSIINHFLRYPLIAPGSWESAIITAVNQRQLPDPGKVTDRPDFQPIGSGATLAKLQVLRKGRKTAELEQYYRKLEALEDV